jgi:hypothetical protein
VQLTQLLIQVLQRHIFVFVCHNTANMQSLTHHRVSLGARSSSQPFTNASSKQRLLHPRDRASRSSGVKQAQQHRTLARSANQPQTTQQQMKSFADMTIDDLDTNYCDDFVCTSSPAVEQTVRSLVSTSLCYSTTAALSVWG